MIMVLIITGYSLIDAVKLLWVVTLYLNFSPQLSPYLKINEDTAKKNRGIHPAPSNFTVPL